MEPSVASSTGGHLTYVRLLPVFGNLLPVKEGVLDDSLAESKAAFLKLLRAFYEACPQEDCAQASSVSHTTALQMLAHGAQAAPPPDQCPWLHTPSLSEAQLGFQTPALPGGLLGLFQSARPSRELSP